jgi:hypothetical protein
LERANSLGADHGNQFTGVTVTGALAKDDVAISIYKKELIKIMS